MKFDGYGLRANITIGQVELSMDPTNKLSFEFDEYGPTVNNNWSNCLLNMVRQ